MSISKQKILMNRVVKVYLPSLPYNIYKLEAKKRGVSMSELFKIAMYDFIYRPLVGISSGKPIVRLNVDRTPKGNSAERSNFGKVVNELKAFDITSLRKVPEDEKRHIYNVVVRG